MRLSDFNFDLPDDLIALRPVEPRDHARLLHVAPQMAPEIASRRAPYGVADHRVCDLPDLLSPNDLLVINNTRVIPVRLTGERRRGDTSAKIEMTLIDRLENGDWRALARPAKRLHQGDIVTFAGQALQVVGRDGATVTVRFDEGQRPAMDTLKQFGDMPIPPYIAKKRPPDRRDHDDYQTLFARHDGAVAAPTAGLHFTQKLIDRLTDHGIGLADVTLHVGAGTFLPLDEDRLAGDRLHSEWGEVGPETVAAITETRAKGGRVVAVGTTTLRILESAAQGGALGAFHGETDIFIKPGYRFQIVDMLITNFHLPQSSLFMLVCAFCGTQSMQGAYAHAIENGYRFYSYGDACLLERIVEI